MDNDENEHQLSLRTVILGVGAENELHIVEAKAMKSNGSHTGNFENVCTAKVCLEGLEIISPVVLQLTCCSGSVHSGG